MKVIFLIGPFRGATAWAIAEHVRQAERYALEVWRLGAVAVCPQANSQHFHGVLPDEVFLDGYLELLSRCDAALLLPGWPDSPGSVAEVAIAEQADLPVLNTLEELRHWLLLNDLVV